MIEIYNFIKAFAGGNNEKALKLRDVEKVFIREARNGRVQQNQGKAKKKTKKIKHQKLVLKKKRRKTEKRNKGTKKYTNRQSDTCESGVTTQCMEVIAF